MVKGGQFAISVTIQKKSNVLYVENIILKSGETLMYVRFVTGKMTHYSIRSPITQAVPIVCLSTKPVKRTEKDDR